MNDAGAIADEITLQKRKSVNELGDPPAKRARTQTKAVIREKKPKTARGSLSKKSTKVKKTAKPKKQKEDLSSVAPSERRRSGRAHKVSDYRERDDADDEEEMLEGVAEWDYDDSDAQESGSDDDNSELSDDAASDEETEEEQEQQEEEEQDEGDEEAVEEEAVPANRSGSKAAPSKGKGSVKASVLAKLDGTSRSSRGRGRPSKNDEMNI